MMALAVTTRALPDLPRLILIKGSNSNKLFELPELL
jgi:hypothetical protein